jgi:hypothetical protein
MATDEAVSTLVSWLSKEVIQPNLEKRPFGGYDVRYSPVLFGSVWLFAKGAVLGRARSDRFEMLMKLFGKPGTERDLCRVLHDGSIEAVKKYGKEPDSFSDFWMKTGLPDLETLLSSDLETKKRASRVKRRLGEIMPQVYTWLLVGIGFGATYPQLTERMWRRDYETRAPELHPIKRRIAEVGGVVDGPWEPAPLEEQEHELLVLVACFAGEHCPELVEPLGLVGELEEGRKDVERQQGGST